MEIKQILDNFLEVAKEVGDDSAIKLIEELSEKNSNQLYELPLIGQFSSGKSASINHLLGRDLLPTRSIESTAFATFISYSESEYATLELMDGSVENISFEEIKQLDNSKVVEIGKPIKALNIGVNCDLLKSGLTFVDTPGVNTIITTHIEITERILNSAQCIVYVTAKNFTDEDVLMIKTIEAHNIPVIFVRTHLDDIKKSEENWQLTIKENEKSIAELLGHPIHFFAISNDSSKEEFQNNFDILKDYLSKEISGKVKKVFESATLERLEPIRKELDKALSLRHQTFLKLAGKSIADIEKQKSKIEFLQEDWKKKLLNQQSFVQKKADEVKIEATKAIRKIAESKIYDFDNAVSNLDGCVKSISTAINDSLSKAASSLNKTAETFIQDGANSICRRLGEDMMTIESELNKIDIESDCHFDMSVAMDYTERFKILDEEFNARVAQINDIKEELSKRSDLSGKERTDIENAILQVEDEIKVYQNDIENISNSYQPQYVEKESQVGKIGKMVGNVLDIAMLFIPSSGWTKAGKWISKAGKSGSIVRKGGQMIGKGAKILAKTDAAKDAVTILGGLKNANDRLNGELKKTSIFDYFSLAYWFEKAGEKFDPSTLELDQQYEQEFRARVSDAESQLQTALEKKKHIIANLARLNGEKWKSDQEKAEVDKMSKNLMRETQELKSKLEIEKDKAVRISLISQAKRQFANRINEYIDLLANRISNMVDSSFSSILDSANYKINIQLKSLSEQLSEIIKNKDSCIESKNQKISFLIDLSSRLKNINV